MMSNLAIKVENLSKRYRIGLREEVHDTLGGALVAWARRPAQNLRRLRRMTRFSEKGWDEEDVIWALKDVSFEVNQGEVVGVIGRNGAGKSTLLKILSRITQPTSGRVELHGRVSSLLEVGTGFHAELTGRENIYLNGTILGMSKAEIDKKFDEIVEFSGVEKFIDTPVKRYSSGMMVRLAFSVAAHLEPEILLVDEVLAVGDAEFQRKCLGKMGEVARGGRTVVFVSHNMGAVRNLCQRVIWLQAGTLHDQGHSFELVEKYLSVGASSSEKIVLSADDEKPMRLREISVIDSSGVTTNHLSMSSPFWVSVTYDINQKVRGAHVICFIVTHDGVTVLGSGDADCEPQRLGLRLPGQYTGKFSIPAHLLGEGRYYLTVSLGIPFVNVFDRHEHILSFEITDVDSRRRELQHLRRPGILGMEIPWQYGVEPIGEE